MKVQYRIELLKLLDSMCLSRDVVECGVAEGRFSWELYMEGVESLYLVDIWETVPFIEGCASFEPAWHNENYKAVYDKFSEEDNVRILKGYSHKMAEAIPDGSISLVYIDADHTYNGVKSDIKTWWPKLKPAGIMAFHDYANPAYGVSRAVIEFIGETSVHIIEEDGKIENIGAWIQK